MFVLVALLSTVATAGTSPTVRRIANRMIYGCCVAALGADQFKGFSLSVDVSLITPVFLRSVRSSGDRKFCSQLQKNLPS